MELFDPAWDRDATEIHLGYAPVREIRGVGAWRSLRYVHYGTEVAALIDLSIQFHESLN